MAIVPMKKVLICGMKKDRKQTLEFLQRQGVIEISEEIREDEQLGKKDVVQSKAMFDRNMLLASQAVQVLLDYEPEQKSMLKTLAGRKPLTVDEYNERVARRKDILSEVNRILESAKHIGEMRAALLKKEEELLVISPWENFDLPLGFKGTKTTKAFIGTIEGEHSAEDVTKLIYLSEQVEETAISVQLIKADKLQTGFMVVCARTDADALERALQRLEFVRAPSTKMIPTEEVKSIEKKIKELGGNIEAETEQLLLFSKDREDIKFLADYYKMRSDKYEVLGDLVQSKNTFFITGYIPADQSARLEKLRLLVENIAIEFETPDKEEDTPILLKNNILSRPVESVVASYSMPGRGEVDPSTVVALFYYILYGMMLSDAGYGLLMVIACGICLWKFKNMESGLKKSLQMFLYCGIATIFWGVMFGSFFGDAVNVIATTFFGRPDIAFPALWFEPINSPVRMLVFSLLVGIIHIFVGLFVKLYICLKNRDIKEAVFGVITWYLLVGGGIVYLLTMPMITNMLSLGFVLPKAAGDVSAGLAAIGALGIILMEGRSSKNWGKRILKGLYGVYGITSYLSDILSYSRLLALGLATGVISTVFNKLGSMLGGGVFGAIVFILVFLIGHALNLAINALGAYVHTNRLEYVEFFGKFYEGGGKAFTPFKINTKYYNVKEDN